MKKTVFGIITSVLIIQCSEPAKVYKIDILKPPKILDILLNGAPVTGQTSLFVGDTLVVTLNVDNPSQTALNFSVDPLPPGAVFTEATGTLSWVPSLAQAGGYTFTFTVAVNGRPDLKDSRSASLSVWSPPKILDILVNGLPVTGTGYLFAGDSLVVAPSVDNPSSAGLRFSMEPIPSGGIFNEATGTLTWVPFLAQAGVMSFSFTVSAANRPDISDSRNAALTIWTPVSLSLLPLDAQVREGLSLQFTATVTGGPTSDVTWSVNSTLGGNSTIGTVSTNGLYTAPAVHPDPSLVTIRVTSAADPGKSATARLTILTPPLPRPYLGTFDIVMATQPTSVSIIPVETDGQISLKEAAALTVTGSLLSVPITTTNATGVEIAGVNMTPVSLSDGGASVSNPDNGSSLGTWFWSFFDLPAGGPSGIKTLSYLTPGAGLTVRVRLYSDNPELFDVQSDCRTGKVTAIGRNLGTDPGAGNKATVSHNIKVRGRTIQEDHVENWADTTVRARLGGGVTQGYVAVTKSGQPTNRREVTATGCRNRVYVTNFIGNSVSVFNSTTMSLIDVLPLGAPTTRNCSLDGVMAPSVAVVDPEFSRLYTVAFYAGAVHALDLSAPTLTPIPGSPFSTGSGDSSFPAGMALDPLARRLYVGNFSASTLAVLDTTKLTHIPGSPFSTPGTPGDMVVDPVAHRLYITHFFTDVTNGLTFIYKGGTTYCEEQQNTFSVWDTENMTYMTVTTLPGPIGLALDQDSHRLFVGHSGTVCTSDWGATWNVGPPGIEVFTTTTLTKIGAMSSAGPNPVLMTYDPETRRLYVNNFGNTVLSDPTLSGCIQALNGGGSSLRVYNTNTLLPIGSPYATGIQPIGIGYDPSLSLLAIANYGSNTLTVYNTTFMTQVVGSPFTTGGAGPVGVVAVEPGLFPLR